MSQIRTLPRLPRLFHAYARGIGDALTQHLPGM